MHVDRLGMGTREHLGMIKIFYILIVVLITCCMYVFLNSSNCTQNGNILLYINYASIELIFKISNWFLKYMQFREFPGGAVVKNPPANAGDTGSICAPGRSHMPRSN